MIQQFKRRISITVKAQFFRKKENRTGFEVNHKHKLKLQKEKKKKKHYRQSRVDQLPKQ